MRGGEDGLVGAPRPHAVAPGDLVGVRAGLAGQHTGEGTQPDHLVAQPAVVQLVQQVLRVGDERPRIGRRLGVDRGGQLRRAEVGVDDPVVVPAEPQAQPDVPHRCRSAHAPLTAR